MSFASCPLGGHHQEESGSVFSLFHISCFYTLIRFSHASLVYTVRAPSVSSYVRFSSPLTIIVALCSTRSSMSTSLLYWRAQDWSQHCRCGFSPAEESRRITCLDLLEMLFKTQPWRLLATFAARSPCWFMVSLLSPKTPRAFPAKLLCNQLASARAGTCGYSPLGAGLWLNSTGLLFACCKSL